ncbi:hypothetical protein NPIL_323481 [Nephila pilipes]|uniref:Sushi domain-containing protein n=1 Tax=Nephila pilipes TaxID=299642 RepID=A0A8X6Q8K4_NEPPI|nr:hypothetical protein NPIL_323481 [Nephila pilipes]
MYLTERALGASALLTCEGFAQVLNAICRPSDLPNGVRIVGLCSYQNPDVCNAYCVNHGKIIWKENTTCLPDGKWSPLPICHAANSLEVIRCNKLIDMTQNNLSACLKIKIGVRGYTSTPKALCPEILRLFVKFGNCSTKPGTKCAVSCNDGTYVLLCVTSKQENCTLPVSSLCPELRNVELINCSRVHGAFCKVRCPNGVITTEEIVCLSTNRWSPLPSCNFRSQCAGQKLPSKVRFINNTCKRSTALRCKVGCDVRVSSPVSYFNIHQLVFVKDIECNSTGFWHGLPDCEKAKKMFLNENTKKRQCPQPKRYKNSFLQKNCSLTEGSVCHYKCRKGYISSGSNSIRCFMKQWIGEPICKPVSCPPLPKTLHFDNTCRRTIGSSCYLQCKSGILEGSRRITCYFPGKWSTLPNCLPSSNNCPSKISPYITFVHNCSLNDKAKCQIRCPRNFALVGWHFIRCENGTWKNIPQCFPARISPYKLIKIKCTFPPPLYGNLKLIGLCNPEGGVTCDVTCRDDSARMTGPNATTCLPPGLWSKIKPCSGGKLYCPPPVFHKHLEVTEDCSGKEVSSKCYVRCKYRPEMRYFIICTNKLKWSTLPRCTCPLPVLRNDIGFLENCSYKHPGEKCVLTCKKRFSMVKGGNIMCTNKLRWSSLPACKRPRCLKPKLTKVLSFKEDCSSKHSGDHCKLECKEGGQILKHSSIQCIKAMRWTKQPNCACPFPFLTKGVKMNRDCRKILPGQKCFLSCKSNLLKISRNYITCETNTRWSSTPECKRKTCPRPVLPKTLIFEEDCTSKGLGDRCHVSCKELGRSFKSNYVVCLNNIRWTPLPICTCPIPSLPDFVETKNDCKSKFPGQYCILTCRKGMKMEGKAAIFCQNNTKWSKIPKCKQNYCHKKKLPGILLYSEDCTAVSPRERCFLECKEGGKFFGRNFIVCIHRYLWTPLPTCSCPVPNLSDDLTAVENCSKKRIGEKCRLKCKGHKSLVDKNYIICKNNTRWGHLPKCKRFPCARLSLPIHLGFKESCSTKYPGESCRLKCKSGGEIIGNHYVTCIEGKKWTNLPKCACSSPNIRDEIVLIENCSRKLIGQTCRLKCKLNQSEVKHIICKTNAQWSPLPKCKTSYCIPLKIPKMLTYAENCTLLLPGQSCSVKCKAGGKLIGSNKIICKNITTWSIFPQCTCTFPLLTEDLTTTEKCNYKKVGETCRVICRKSLKLVGNDLLTCQKDARWSPSPRCKRIFCPKPKLNSVLNFGENCSSKRIGEKCHVICRESLILVGNDFIICQEDARWSPSPRCKMLFCTKPKLSSVLKFLQNCSSKAIGEKCQLQCREGGSLIGPNSITCKINTTNLYWTSFPHCTCLNPILPKNLKKAEDCRKKKPGEICNLRYSNKRSHLGEKRFIRCQHNTKWSPLPQCKTQFCPKPMLSSGLKLLQNCSSKALGEKCFIKCNDSFILLGHNFIICQENALWSPSPQCKKLFCPNPKLSSVLKLQENCSSKAVGEKCQLQCREGGRGTNYITCKINATNLHWSSFPYCTCLNPVLPKNIKTAEDCNKKKQGEICQLKCSKETSAISGKNFIRCQNNTKWSPSPQCKMLFCPKPKINSILKFHGNCSSKLVGQKCELLCREGGSFIGKDYITCNINATNLSWSSLPQCTCLSPALTKDIKTAEHCNKNKPGQACNLICSNKSLTMVGDKFIICQKNTKWSPLPQCKKQFCPKPMLNRTLKSFENCSFKAIGEKCHIICNNSYNLIGKDFIICQTNALWSPFPQCKKIFCPTPKLSDDLQIQENCSSKETGQKCHVTCNEFLILVGKDFILCQADGHWSPMPQCKMLICPTPNWKRFHIMSEKCSLESFAAMQKAVLSQTKLSNDLKFRDNCDLKAIGEKCHVACDESLILVGNDSISCQKNALWSPLPQCKKQFCPKPKLSSDLNFLENCSSKAIGEKCHVACNESLISVRNDSISCQKNALWSPLPQCKKQFCPKPKLSNDLKFRENCSSKAIGEKCHVACDESLILVGNDSISCQKNVLWSPLPQCKKQFCPKPKLSNDLKFRENCALKAIGEKCHVACNESLISVGNYSISCQKNALWSPLPQCKKQFCPKPKLSNDLKFRENCASKAIGEKCHVACDESAHFSGRRFYFMSEKCSLESFAAMQKAVLSQTKIKQRFKIS